MERCKVQDIRDTVFRDICAKQFRAELLAERDGILSGVEEAVAAAKELGVVWNSSCKEGDKVTAGKPFAELIAGPKEMAMAEECVMGALSKASGIATAANHAVSLANGRVEIVAGAWKKMPPSMKHAVRQAVVSGGAQFRMCNLPMLYMDKNFVSMFGSVKAILQAVSHLTDMNKVVQIRGKLESVEQETLEALEGGATVLMVDTGRKSDVDICLKLLEEKNCRSSVKVAFAGNVSMEDIPMYADMGIDILCIGKEIVDAPLLDMKLNVLEEV